MLPYIQLIQIYSSTHPFIRYRAKLALPGTWKMASSSLGWKVSAVDPLCSKPFLTKSFANHRMSSISLVSIIISGNPAVPDDPDIVVAVARNPTIRERGNGQGWLAINWIDCGLITTPLSSYVSRWQHSSKVSPTSQNPANVEYLPIGHDFFLPNKAYVLQGLVTSMIVAESMRG